MIEIEKSPGSSIGIKLTSTKSAINGKNQILVESVKPASIADRCGAIYVGDQILSIDDVSFEHVTLAEANQILKNCVGEFSRVEILPLSQMNANKAPSSKSNILNNYLVKVFGFKIAGCFLFLNFNYLFAFNARYFFKLLFNFVLVFISIK